MSIKTKIAAALEAIEGNLPLHRYLSEALKEIEGEFDALAERIKAIEEKLVEPGAHADEARQHAEAAARAAQAASVAANQAAIEAKAATAAQAAPQTTQNALQQLPGAAQPAADAAPVAPAVQGAPMVPPIVNPDPNASGVQGLQNAA